MPQSSLSKEENKNSQLSHIYKNWIRALNQWVIRDESLKKYQVQAQIGVGAQAKVYRIIKRRATSNQ